jgi:hypothetical protein
MGREKIRRKGIRKRRQFLRGRRRRGRGKNVGKEGEDKKTREFTALFSPQRSAKCSKIRLSNDDCSVKGLKEVQALEGH